MLTFCVAGLSLAVLALLGCIWGQGQRIGRLETIQRVMLVMMDAEVQETDTEVTIRFHVQQGKGERN